MKYKYFAIIALFSISYISASGQVTDAEKTLRALSTDTAQGWKKGGVFAINLGSIC